MTDGGQDGHDKSYSNYDAEDDSRASDQGAQGSGHVDGQEAKTSKSWLWYHC